MSVCGKRLTRVQSAYIGVWRSGKPLGEGEWEDSEGRQEITSEQSTFSKDKTWEMYTWVGGMGSVAHQFSKVIFGPQTELLMV